MLVVAHVDDLLCGGPREQCRKFKADIGKYYEMKGKMLGDVDDKGELITEIKFLSRTIAQGPRGYIWRADAKHRRILLEEWGMAGASGVDTPFWPDDGIDPETKELMTTLEGFRYRRAVARLNYLSQDRVDLNTASCLLSRSMAKPREGDDLKVKRVLRYLIRVENCDLVFDWQDPPKLKDIEMIGSDLRLLTDSDWAGCKQTRKSTSGTVIFLGKHVLTFSCRMQKSTALSSGEAELIAQTDGLTEAIGISRLLMEQNMQMKVESFCDSSAAKGTLQRTGAGRIKHIETRNLWGQDMVSKGLARITHISRSINCADVLTHSTSKSEFMRLLQLMGVRFCFSVFPPAPYRSAAEGECWNMTSHPPYIPKPFLTKVGLSHFSSIWSKRITRVALVNIQYYQTPVCYMSFCRVSDDLANTFI